MCGIFGHSNLISDKIEHSHNALHTLSHRGPDGWHYQVEDDVYLGHRRLSIIDLSINGRQPMVAGGVYLTVNGEIYNYKDLRQQLIDLHGVKFNSDSDSEVLLHGYIHWGMECLLDVVDGMFALVIYDSNKGIIFLARDHIGIKPLYYGLIDGNLSWGSELKALEAFYGKDNLSIDATAVYDFMTYLYVPCPKTLYNDIYKLEPGHFLTFDVKSKNIEHHQYWSLDNVAPSNTDIKSAMHTAVQEQLVSDVPVGFFLSGGVDSSVVCYEASTFLSEISTFSIGHVDKDADESPFAKMVAVRIGSKHFGINFSQEIANKNFPLIRDFYDEPFGDVSALPTNEVCKLARAQVTVVLTGDGGDELFGGYSHYNNAENIFNPKPKSKAWLRPFIVAVQKYAPHRSLVKKAKRYEIETINDPIERWSKARGGLLKTDPFKIEWARKNSIPADYDDYWYYRKHDKSNLSPRTRAQYLDFNTYMHDSVLTKVDRASMNVSLETRVPFLSKKMIAAAWSVSEEARYLDGELKSILKSTYKDDLPTDALYRPKQGFGIGRVGKKDKLYDKSKNLPKQILQKLFPEIMKMN